MIRVKKNFRKLSTIAIATLIASNSAFASDISSHWAKDTIEDLSKQGIISGYKDDSFRPDNYITRAEYISLINKAMKFSEAKEVAFNDVKKGDWFSKDVAIAVAAGYLKGYEDNTFKPNNRITRAEAAIMLSRAVGGEGTSTGKFTDDANIPAWAKNEIYKMANEKFILGYSDGTFKPENNITRAEAFSMTQRVVKTVASRNEVAEKKAEEITEKKEAPKKVESNTPTRKGGGGSSSKSSGKKTDNIVQDPQAQRQLVEEIHFELERIKEKNLVLEDAKASVAKINNNVKKLPKDVLDGILELSEKDKVASEITEYENLKNFKLTLSGTGELTLEGTASEKTKDAIKMSLVKDLSEKNEKSINIENKKDVQTFNVLPMMRNSGVGKYTIEFSLSKDFFEHFSIAFLENEKLVAEGETDIKAINLNLEKLSFKGENLDEESSSANVYFDKETGEITWDDVDNAEFYDVYANVTVGSREGYWGKYYLVEEARNYVNLQNEFSRGDLESIDNGFFKLDEQKGQTDGSRVFAAIGLTEKRINIKDIAPTQSVSFSPRTQIGDEDEVYIAIYVVPRNKGNFITEELKYENLVLVSQNKPQVVFSDMPWSAVKKYFGRD